MGAKPYNKKFASATARRRKGPTPRPRSPAARPSVARRSSGESRQRSDFGWTGKNIQWSGAETVERGADREVDAEGGTQGRRAVLGIGGQRGSAGRGA